MAAFSALPALFSACPSAIRIFSTVQGLDEVGETFPADLDSDTEQNERREPEKDDGSSLSQGSGSPLYSESRSRAHQSV
jgi:hypothetical protein